MAAGVVHFAGVVATVGGLSRQRCAWCGALIVEITPDQRAWPPGSFVSVGEGIQFALPPGALIRERCWALDPEVTR